MLLCCNEEEVDLEAKLDTGAEYCVFERSYAEALGLQVEAGELVMFSTATGRFVAFGHWVVIHACGFDVETFAYFAESREFRRNVLGMCGWIDRFQVAIDHQSSRLFLNKL